MYFMLSTYFYIMAFVINEDKLYGGLSDSVVNLLLVVPQCLSLANYNT